ncbi:MAG: radical SAM protein [Promethearchaeia archaeon]
MKELVIDITYECNSNCNYCQWSAANSKKPPHLPLDRLQVPKKTLDLLNISRVTFSGGEPLISKNLIPLIHYYRNHNMTIRLLSNGIDVTHARVQHLLQNEVSEFIFSVDSFNYHLYSKNRDLPRRIFEKAIKNLRSLANIKRKGSEQKIFIGLNVVLTAPTCNWQNISQMLKAAEREKIDQVKFQPVFDDGYLSKNAPELSLSEVKPKKIREIKSQLIDLQLPSNFTNPPGFWEDLYCLLTGDQLNPAQCKVMEHSILLHEGILKFCFWCTHTTYGSITEDFSKEKVERIERNFQKNLPKCRVLPQCFCLQPLDHQWHTQKPKKS